MNSIYINPIVLSANPPRSTPPPPIQPFVSRYFLVRHSNTSNSYQQFQRTTHPQMRMQFINMSTTNYIGFPLRKSSSSNNLQQFHHQVHPINSAKDDTQQRNCSKGGQKDSKSGQKENLVSDFSLNHNQKSSHHKSKGNKQSGGSTKRNEKNTFSHPWLASTLKGHTDDIRDIDFSSNGKYLASCGEDSANSNTSRHRRPSGSEDVNSSSSSSNEEVPTYQAKPTKKAAKSRRQRRIQKKQQAQLDGEPIPTKTSNVKKSSIAPQSVSNTKRGSNASLSSTSSSASSSPIPTKIDKLVKISRALAPPLRQHTKLNLKEKDLVKYLKYYVIESHLLRMYGYPVESVIHSGSIEIFKCTFKTLTNATKPFNNQIINQNDGLVAPKKTEVSNSSGDSGQGSGTSSPPSVDSDSSEVGEEDSTTTTSFCTPDGYQIFAQYNNNSIEKQCVRCQQSFMVSESGEYLTTDECCYHWGKLLQIYVAGKGLVPQYSCCNGDSESVGCSYNPLHVWTGIVCGMNGPYDDFVHTKYKDCDSTDDKKVYALDCEMIFTGLGLEVAKVSVVSCEGQIVYEHFVRPKGQISDYNTRFSGIIESDLKISTSSKSNQVKTLEQVQRDLLGFISADTILIGHGLENDLRVLKIIHKNIIDTSISFPHANGFPYRRALKNLTKTVLKRDIQTSDSGHSSFEDSRACLELMLWKVRKELLTIGHAI